MVALAANSTLAFLRTRLNYELRRATAEVRSDLPKPAKIVDRESRPLSTERTVEPLWQRAIEAREDAQRSRRVHATFMRWRAEQRTRRCGQIVAGYFGDRP